MIIYRLFAVVAFALCLSCSSLALAESPDAGQFLNQQRQPGTRLPDRPPQDIGKETERPTLHDTGPKVLVKGFRFRVQSSRFTV